MGQTSTHHTTIWTYLLLLVSDGAFIIESIFVLLANGFKLKCEFWSHLKIDQEYTNLALSTLGTSHDKAGVRQVTLAILSAVNIGATALNLNATRLDGCVDGNGVGAFGLLGSAVALNLATFGITK